ncbi:hypothetical protein AJ87_11245 [Rhizobium yanglingense]|nr:hypothetical protein AJ87_11245 [Rhizobium yanglingense]
MFHDFILVTNQRSGRIQQITHARSIGIFERGAHEGTDLVYHGKLDRADLQHLGAERGHFEHFLESDLFQSTRLRHDARIGRIDAVDIGIDIAAIGFDSSRDRHRRRIRTAAAKRRYPIVRPETLEAGDDGNLTLAHALNDIGTVDFKDAGSAMRIVGADRNLPALPGARIDVHGLQRDRQQPAGHLLTGSDDRVILARIVEW